MPCIFYEWKDFISGKLSALLAKIKIRRKLGEIEELAVSAGKNVKTGFQKLVSGTVPVKKKKPGAVKTLLAVLGTAAAVFTLLVAVFSLFFALTQGKKRSGYVTVKR